MNILCIYVGKWGVTKASLTLFIIWTFAEKLTSIKWRISRNVALCCFLSFLALYLCESVASCFKVSTRSATYSSAKSSLYSLPSSKTVARASPAVKRTSRLGEVSNWESCSNDLKYSEHLSRSHYFQHFWTYYI